ncbi:acyl- dehydrogenase [Lentinula edodes]|uniref:Acyl-dehydrogenase n=1 Tax=Lentinula edodes TaxID=5353 RepID=A0A1Q3ELE0_LENED|nr:acyl- dehydrogenase [Lentinula edodes]
MKVRQYCCCAIPIVNAGIYAALTEQLVAAVLIGVLSFATPSIVGAATPSFAPLLLGIVCLVAGAVQFLGFLGVASEKPILFRRYVTLHGLAVVAAFALAAAWISSIPPTRPNNPRAILFVTSSPGLISASWLEYGFGSLSCISYSSAQQQDHIKYDALNDPTNPLNGEGIPMNSRDPWDARTSTDYPGGYTHGRQPNYEGSLSHPNNAYTQDPGPTPKFNDPYYDDSSDLNRPSQAQAHPAEGSFGRKTPRLTKPTYNM